MNAEIISYGGILDFPPLNDESVEKLARLFENVGGSVNLGTTFLELSYSGRDAGRAMLQSLAEAARIIGGADGEITCSLTTEYRDPSFEFYRVQDGHLVLRHATVSRATPVPLGPDSGNAPSGARAYSAYLTFNQLSADQVMRIEQILDLASIEGDVGPTWLEFEYRSFESGDLILRVLRDIASSIGTAEGEIVAEPVPLSSVSVLLFYTISDGAVLVQRGEIVCGSAEVIRDPVPMK